MGESGLGSEHQGSGLISCSWASAVTGVKDMTSGNGPWAPCPEVTLPVSVPAGLRLGVGSSFSAPQGPFAPGAHTGAQCEQRHLSRGKQDSVLPCGCFVAPKATKGPQRATCHPGVALAPTWDVTGQRFQNCPPPHPHRPPPHPQGRGGAVRLPPPPAAALSGGVWGEPSAHWGARLYF